MHPHDDSGNYGHQHPSSMCCHCERTEAMDREADIAMREMGVPAHTEEHEYLFTVTGRCARRGCGRPEQDHIKLTRHPDAVCGVDHASIKPRGLLIGDRGAEWQTCPSCFVQLEPRSTAGGPQGPMFGKGRGWVSPRMKARWEFIARIAMQDDESKLRSLESRR